MAFVLRSSKREFNFGNMRLENRGAYANILLLILLARKDSQHIEKWESSLIHFWLLSVL
jgi:hypothetical protein